MNTSDHASRDTLREHYELEKRLAARLRDSTSEERRTLYRELYDELYRWVGSRPPEPQASMCAGRGSALALIAPYLSPESVFMEIGAGDGWLSRQVASRVSRVYAVEVSSEVQIGVETPENFEWVLSDGIRTGAEPGSIDVVLSNQLVEHIHPDDVASHFRDAYAALGPGGHYVCLTPHRFSGPHDVSKHFDDVATGFHLHEYTAAELADVMRATGFTSVRQVAGARGQFVTLPRAPALVLERLVGRIPSRPRRALCRWPGVSALFERLVLVARKP